MQDGLHYFEFVALFFLLVFTLSFTNPISTFLAKGGDEMLSAVLPALLFDETNEARLEAGLSPLSEHEELNHAAQLKADHMAEYGYFAHYSPDGSSPWRWFREAGYDYAYAGENLAVRFSDSRRVVKAWLDSPSHRANILNEKYEHVGFATARGMYKGSETVFVVQLFGADD